MTLPKTFGGLPHALLGSVAENVMRTSPVPVLIVHGNKPPLEKADDKGTER